MSDVLCTQCSYPVDQHEVVSFAHNGTKWGSWEWDGAPGEPYNWAKGRRWKLCDWPVHLGYWIPHER